jgi:hypothetical protein
LDVVGNEEKDESILRLEIPHSIKDNNILEQPRIDYIETWFQRIVGQTMQSDFEHIWFIFSPVHLEDAPESLVQAPICSPLQELILNISWMLEWLHWNSTYT